MQKKDNFSKQVSNGITNNMHKGYKELHGKILKMRSKKPQLWTNGTNKFHGENDVYRVFYNFFRDLQHTLYVANRQRHQQVEKR